MIAVRFRTSAFLALGVGVLSLLGGCGKRPELAPPEPPGVTVMTPLKQEHAPAKEFTGRLATKDPVKVIPQVTGMVLKREFKDGDLVEEGKTVLYRIDPTLFDADVERAKADVLKAKADSANWKAQEQRDAAELTRVKDQLAKGVGVPADEDKAKASVEVDKANVKVAEAAEKAAEANLVKAKESQNYTVIMAPATGRVGESKVPDRSVVNAYQTVLTEVYPVDPIYAYFDVDELTSLWYRERIYVAKTIPDPKSHPMKCWIKLKDEEKFSRESTIDFVDPIINRNTGTRTVRATFPNKDGRLSSGDSVRVRVEAGRPAPVLMIPERAVQSAQRERYVFVVNAENVAEIRKVEVGETVEGMTIIDKGLTEQDRVATTNILRVRPGVKVTVLPGDGK